MVGERSMGDARLDYQEITYSFFDRFLKGEKSAKIRFDAEGDVLHDGDEQVADVRDLAACRRANDDDVSIQWGPRELFDRRWGACPSGSSGE